MQKRQDRCEIQNAQRMGVKRNRQPYVVGDVTAFVVVRNSQVRFRLPEQKTRDRRTDASRKKKKLLLCLYSTTVLLRFGQVRNSNEHTSPQSRLSPPFVLARVCWLRTLQCGVPSLRWRWTAARFHAAPAVAVQLSAMTTVTARHRTYAHVPKTLLSLTRFSNRRYALTRIIAKKHYRLRKIRYSRRSSRIRRFAMSVKFSFSCESRYENRRSFSSRIHFATPLNVILLALSYHLEMFQFYRRWDVIYICTIINDRRVKIVTDSIYRFPTWYPKTRRSI